MVFRDCDVGSQYRHGATSCRNDAYRYMLRHFPRLTARTNFRCHVDLDTMVCLLNNPAVQANPHQRLDGALSWVRFHPRERSQYLDTLLAQLPGALLSKQVLKGLLKDPIVSCSQRNINAVNDLMSCQNEPYHESGCLHGLGLTDLRENGGAKAFGFISAEGAAEFEVVVDASPCMTHFKYSLTCNRIAIPESCQRLPDCVRADLKVELCAQDGCSSDMVTVHCGVSEESNVNLVSEVRKVEWSRRFQLDQSQMRQFVANGSKFSLFVHVKALEVNGRREQFYEEEECEEACASSSYACNCQWSCYPYHSNCNNTAATSPLAHCPRAYRRHSCRHRSSRCQCRQDRCRRSHYY